VDILLVDDNPLMQQLIARFLGDLGYQVGVAGRADEAIALARGTPPHLFMIDTGWPRGTACLAQAAWLRR
jgi:DNA-binding response OmpR family regulator